MGDGEKSGRASRRRKIDIWRVACLGGKVTAQSPVWLEPQASCRLMGSWKCGGGQNWLCTFLEITLVPKSKHGSSPHLM